MAAPQWVGAEKDPVTPADIYTAMIALVVIQVLVMAWLLDRLAEARRETEEAKQDARYWKRRAGQSFPELQSQVWETKA
jgi:uncharacterized membrane protein